MTFTLLSLAFPEEVVFLAFGLFLTVSPSSDSKVSGTLARDVSFSGVSPTPVEKGSVWLIWLNRVARSRDFGRRSLWREVNLAPNSSETGGKCVNELCAEIGACGSANP